jgi:beta-N-acetylhexosaminidase
VIVFSRNVASAGQVRDLIRRLQNQRPRGSPPLLVMTDQEGGDVRRIPGPPSKPAAALGAERGGAVERAGRETGCNLARAGVNVDLAPVADVARTGSAIAAEGRAFGTSPGIVSRRAVRFAAGLRRAGVAATAKHFPGFGAAPANTDTASVTIDRTRSELEADLAPFRALIERRIPLVMLSTAIYPALSARPAALSPEVAGTLLRHELGFHGVTVTDDLEGAAVSSYGSPAGLAARAVRAGADLAMFAQSLDTGVAAARGLAREIATDRSLRRRSRAAGLRVTRLRERLTHDSCR